MRAERPILFSSSMVRAILEGQKTVTRRPVKGGQIPRLGCPEQSEPWVAVGQKHPRYGFLVYGKSEEECAANVGVFGACPYGQRGARLWVRETWHCDHFDVQRGPYLKPDDLDLVEARENGTLVYAADGLKPYEQEQPIWKPSIHMPRWASRIQLEITAVRVERLQDITEEQARAEGVISAERDIDPDGNDYSPLELFGGLWTKLNGMDSWSANPWVWVVEFRRITP